MRSSILRALAPLPHVTNALITSRWVPAIHRHVASSSGAESSSTMLQQLQSRIMLRGAPLSVAEYMQEVLTNPVAGYYMRNDVFGKSGDFVTSPEISQVFGEMIGIWMVSMWMQLGQPPRVQLVELGPGRGTLMADLLRSTSVFRGFREALSVHLVEVSPALRRLQWAKLQCTPASGPEPPGTTSGARGDSSRSSGSGSGSSSSSSSRSSSSPGGNLGSDGSANGGPTASGGLAGGEAGRSDAGGGAGATADMRKAGVSGLNGAPVTWHRGLDAVPEEACPVLVLAHEFFDALPVHQFVRDPQRGWVEKMVDVVEVQGGPEGPAGGPAVPGGPEGPAGAEGVVGGGPKPGLRMVLSPGATPAASVLVPHRLRGLPEAERVKLNALEVGAQGMAAAEALAGRLGRQGGAALVVDYGKDGPFEDSLMAIRGHEGVEVLEAPGTADLSCWVDFGGLRQAAVESGAPVKVHGPVSQRHLLLSLGLEARVNELLKAPDMTEAAAEQLMVASRRLVEGPPSGLGLSYQALAITAGAVQGPPVAFDAAAGN